jgi:hypothetical protein
MRTTLTALIAAATAIAAEATTLVPTDVAEMSREARAIAIGRVASVDARWTPDRRQIETVVTLQADSYLKGSFGSSVRFVVPGGQIGRFRNVVVGAPQFSAGEQVVVFLGARGPAILSILGFNQGLFRVSRSDGAAIVRPSGPALRVEGSGGPLRLDDFARHVRRLVETSR